MPKRAGIDKTAHLNRLFSFLGNILIPSIIQTDTIPITNSYYFHGPKITANKLTINDVTGSHLFLSGGTEKLRTIASKTNRLVATVGDHYGGGLIFEHLRES
jgi:hypothetical protein